ncbi:hypothetical protein ACP_1991 [Acidobacterium capsulatum ATCC 51196]|uniref:Uncharacterized protein n=1 Tax=Acidobacterium capsulatum (strain ATCC 51196 / DSM 11244 / BCRC 80197 / JCM 7670 / NBRC 15755 / NCIMB 13165 / 161) TaxID=240015 RepID=C1F8T6_ACIC5|nr:hypothetical protein ACP_1991 [Acidobacterium capsulatum ATCC 51196]
MSPASAAGLTLSTISSRVFMRRVPEWAQKSPRLRAWAFACLAALFGLRGQGRVWQLDFGPGRGRFAGGRSGVGCSGCGGLAGQAVGAGEAALRGLDGVPGVVLEFERQLVLREGGVAVAVHVIDAAEIDVRPGDEAWIFGDGDGFLEVLDGIGDIAVHKAGAGEHVPGAVRRGRAIGKRLIGDGGGGMGMILRQERFGVVESIGRGERVLDHLGCWLRVEVQVQALDEADFRGHIHAVDHGADAL